jgi:hypothetical protein
MHVAFHLPLHHRPDARRQEAWQAGGTVAVVGEGKTATAQAWIYQTWLRLSEAGTDVALVEDLPKEGVVVTLNGWLSPDFVAPRGLFVAGVVADGLPHAGVDLNIVQNLWHAQRLPGAAFMPHWPQPGLVPRDPARGEKLETVCFFGDPENLAAELRGSEWQRKFSETTGARFGLRGAERWHDYSDVDAVVAVRRFGSGNQPHKPATKLYNAWLAGVPFIAGNDSAYRAEGTPGSDYLTAGSPGEVIARVLELRNPQERRGEIVARGRKRAEELGAAQLTARWRRLLESMAPQWDKKLRKTNLRLAAERGLGAMLCKADSLRKRD